MSEIPLSARFRVEYGSLNARKVKTFASEARALTFYRKRKEEGAEPRMLPASRMDDEVLKEPGRTEIPPPEAPPARRHEVKGVLRTKDVGWTPLKAAVYKALKGLGAVGVSNAVTSPQAVAEAARQGNAITRKNVRHYCYHGVASGLTGVGTVEGVEGYVFYLTRKGAMIDPDAMLAARS